MELRRVRYFIAVAECEHFHRAAERLHVAQPALSRQVRLLEQELGFPVFERVARGVRLTAAGAAFLADAKRISVELDRAVEHARHVASGSAGVLHVSFIEIASWHGVLPDTIRAFRASHPGVRLVLQPLDSIVQVARLKDRSVDAAFVYGGAALDTEIVHRTVHSERFVLALPAAHELASRRQIRLRDLRDEAFIWTDRSLHSHFTNVLMTACAKRGLVPRIVQEVSSSAHILSLVAAGIGLGLVPCSTRWRLQEGLVLKPVVDLTLPFEIDIAWKADNGSPVLRQFADIALAHASPEPREATAE